ncbi:MAG TPA: heme o synthase [Candidatus Saccharimonadia bacterium]
MASLSTYYWLAKPGIVYGNCLAATAGFLLASKGHPSITLYIVMVGGIALVMASGCVFNNYIDRGIDEKMARTKKRALVQGVLSATNALMYGTVLGIIGLAILLTGTNALTFGLALAGLVLYVGVYGYWKRRSVHGTLVGSLAGAIPPVVGYCAVTNRFDLGALLLFLILVLWQMPHFYAIALYRFKDYKAADLPVLPVKQGMNAAKQQAIAYIIAFILVIPVLSVTGYTGYSFAIIMMVIGLVWLLKAIREYRTKDDAGWGRKLFGFSLIVMISLSVMLSVGSMLP